MRRISALAAASMLIAAAVLEGQSFQGGIRGTVANTSGAVVVLARVTLTDESTGAARVTVSNEQGQYAFPALNPATYTVIAESPGFKIVTKKGMVVETQQFLTVDLQLPIGGVTESVNVTEETPLLETNNASTGQLIDNQKLADLRIWAGTRFLRA